MYTVVADVKFLQLRKVFNIGRKSVYLVVTQCQLPQLLQLEKLLQNIQQVTFTGKNFLYPITSNHRHYQNVCLRHKSAFVLTMTFTFDL